MTKVFLIMALIAFGFGAAAQTDNANTKRDRKGDFYIYWGWNRGWYNNSDIHFKGDQYDFTLSDVVAKDRQSPWDANIYLNPANLTIPQYNLRLGYFINNHYDLSFGVDHMKYVMQNDQTVKIDGEISGTGTTFDDTYSNDDMVLTSNFLMFEHTDGLNYLNIELRRFDQIYAYKWLVFNVTEGIGGGVLVPKTNCTLMTNARHDEFHLAGFGLGAVVGINLTVFKHYFIQSEFKAGHINMPDIRTTEFKADKASQHFFYTQFNTVVGVRFFLLNKDK